MTNEKVLNKIRKLQALGNDLGATANESETALRQADYLMKQHGINNADLINAVSSDYEWTSAFCPIGVSIPDSINYIAVGVGRFCDCIVNVRILEDKMGFSFFGEASDVPFAAWLIDYLKQTMNNEAAKLPLGKRPAFKLAFAIRLQQRLIALRLQRDVTPLDSSSAASTGLVVTNRKIALRDQKEQQGKEVAKQVDLNNKVSKEGIKAADKVGFNRPLNSNAQPNILLK